jgi:regulator of sigma E protease
LTTGNPGILWTILSFLLVIGPLVFVHELGHYFVGRWFGVKADTFSIGFGREVAGWTDRRGTRWKLAWLPLGGYVKFAGDMNPASQASPEWLALPPEERARTFQAKSVWKRFLIVLAGPATNFLLAILVYAIFLTVYGESRTPNLVTSIAPQSAAQRAGLKPGDRILALNGSATANFEDIYTYVRIRPSQKLDIAVDRGGSNLLLHTVTDPVQEKDQFGNSGTVGRLGISSPEPVRENVPVYRALGASTKLVAGTVENIAVTLGQLFTGQRSVKELGGPLKIAQVSGQQASLGWTDFILFLTAVSINLGFINLLPIPMLDGGHLLFYAIEAIIRRPLKPQAQEWAFRTGLAALLALMIFVTLNDLASFGLWSKLGSLIG